MKCHELGGVRIKCKKISVIILLLLFSLLMIGAVSAASDANATAISSDVSDTHTTHTDTNTQVDKTNSNNNNEDNIITENKEPLKLKSTNNNNNTNNLKKTKQTKTNSNILTKTNTDTNKLKETNVDSWDKLRTAINNNEEYIILTNDITITGSGTTININTGKIVTINGDGHSIDANNDQIFQVEYGATLILENLKLINGKSSYGGAIYNNEGTLTVTNTTFNSNTAGVDGGAIYNYKGTLNVTNCTFTSNTANGDYGEGGAICNYEGKLTVINTTFTSNTADDEGGAIYNYMGTLTVTNTTFTSNTAEYIGGAIYSSDGSVGIDNGVVSFLTTELFDIGVFHAVGVDLVKIQLSTGDGYNGEVWVNVTNATFNQIVKVNVDNGKGEGTINLPNGNTYTASINVIKDAQVTTQNKEFNTIYDTTSFAALNDEIKKATDNSITLNHNYTYNEFWDTELKTGIPINTKITINGNGHTINATQQGRIFNITNTGDLTLINCTLTEGQLTGTSDNGFQKGGAIYNDYGILTLINSTLTNNTIQGENHFGFYGGAIYNSYGTVVIIDSNLTHNKLMSNGEGGAISNNHGNVTITNSNINYNKIEGDDSLNWGGAISNNGNMTITNSNLTDNQITTTAYHHFGFYGGAINNNAILTIINSNLARNKVIDNSNGKGYGGAINNYDKLIIIDSQLSDNEASEGGSAIHNNGDYAFTIVNTTLTNNKIYFNGGDYGKEGLIDLLTTEFNINSITDVYEGLPVLINVTGLDTGYSCNLTVELKNTTSDIPFIFNITVKNGEAITTKILPIGNYTATFTNLILKDNGNNPTENFMVIGNNSFTALYNNITNSQTGQLTLTHNYTYDNRTDTNLKIGIPINKKFTINGNGYTIDGNNTARIFKIDTSDTVIIKNINFINGNATGNNLQNQMGGAIYFTEGSTGTIENCNFTNNTASKYGGAITLYSNGNVTNCNFTNNTALQIGGAIYIINKGNVTNCNFINNKLTSVGNFGGAIWMNDGSVENCNFTNNTALDSGAIYCNKGNITYCTFTNNTASRYGGAIHVGSGTIENCNFVKNTASTGNAIYKDGSSDLIVNHNIFLNNGLSSVIHRDGSATVNLDYNWFGNNATNHDTFDSNIVDGLTLTNWLFLNAMSTPVTVLSTSDINFKLSLYNNSTKTTSEYDNNLLYPVNLTVTYVNGTGEDRVRLGDTVTFKPDTVGTASVTANISNVRYTIKLTINKAEYDTKITDLSFDPLFEGKESLINGTLTANNTGFANQEITINITNDQSHIETYIGKTDNNGKFSIKIKPQVNGEVTITINYPGNQTDKIIYKPTTNTTTQTVTLNKTSYKYLQTQIQDAINNNKNNITLNWDYKYDNDTDYEYIKGITINNKFTIYGNNHTIDGNKEARIFKVTGNGDLTLVNITLTQGKGQNDGPNNWNVGGAIYTNNTNLTLINATLTENTVENEGGAIYTGNNCKINITNTIFNNNQVTKAHGGAIYATGSNTQININNTIFNQNTANKGDGGAIYAFGPKLSIQNSTFKNNKGNWGGAIYAVSGVTKINIKQTLFNNNTATLGGAIHGQYDAQININNTVINNNTAKTGGAISAIGGSKLNINNTVINNNTATGDGGAIYAQEESTKINIKQTLFNNNTATWGGAIYIRNYSELNIKQTLFNNNSAGMGGAIYTTTNTTLNIKQTLFNNNTANYGGSIAASDTSKINMIQTVLSNNTGLAGGAICIQLNCTLKMTKSLFDNNSASIGGAICTYINCTLNMTESLFDNNTALNGTNLCMLNGGSAYIKDTQIDEKDIYNNKTTTDSELARIEILTTLDKFKFNIIDFTQDTTTTISITEPNGFNGTATLIIGDSKEKVEFINGLANIKLNLKPGTYTATITDIEYYNDPNRNLTCTYLTSNNTTQFTVNNKPTPPSPTPSPEPTPTPTGKVATKILAKQKTFKLETKNKKYTITLKDTNGKTIKKAKVTLKVKRKTYKATTNNKGKATFKITKLNKKGKYTSKITYKGNKKYKATNKKIKITVSFKTIGKNSKNKKMIKKIQKALKKNGYYKHEGKRYLKIDGIYHKYTQKAVKQYQKDKKLQVTGTVNYQTAKKLKII